MDWGRSYSASWRVFRVNRQTWADAEQITDVDTIRITKTADGDLLESGDMDTSGELANDYYRIVMTAEQDGDVARVDVATLLFEVTGGEHNYGTQTLSAAGNSVLYPASTTTVLTGAYAPAGVDGADYAGRMLRSAINAPVAVEGSFTLVDNVVHEIGCTVLDAVWSVLEAGGFVMQIDGRGVVHILPKPTEPALILDSNNLRLLEPGISYTADSSEVPNRYIVVLDANRTVAVNDDPNSPISTVSRGYFVDEVDDSPVLVNGETLSGYAARKLREASHIEEEWKYKREYAPGVLPYSIVRASIDGAEGDLRVDSQTLTCDHGISIEETAVKEVSLWQT